MPAPTPANHNTITRDQLVEMFGNMERKYGWDLSKDMVWGYFFTHKESAALDKLRPVLEQSGYRIVDKFEDEESGVHTLHAERIEKHSVDSLHQRNNELATRAFEAGVTYDGMDVGPATVRGEGPTGAGGWCCGAGAGLLGLPLFC